jgi:hypothetical protein
MKKLLLNLWAPIALFLLVVLLSLANYVPGTFLSGWDNLHPEFYPLMNLERSWQAAWQEYQGLGLLAGMAHGADFFRQLLLLPLTLLLPAPLFRYVWHFLMILIGVLGSFYLFKFFLQKEKSQNLLSFLGASFYLLNFATVQNFYVSFEPFAAFYAFLPWLLLFILKFLYTDKFSRRNLVLFAILSIISSSMFYVQTIFIVYFALVLLALAIAWWQKVVNFKKIGMLLGIVLLSNAFWLINVAHFMITGAALLTDSKGKAMSNEVLLLKNQAFAEPGRLALMQGFWLGETDFDQFGNTVYLFDPWQTHLSQPQVNFIAYSFFVLLLLGLWQFFGQKHQQRYLILWAFVLTWWMMALQSFPFNFLTDVLTKILPFFSEMFRINFTKWVVPFSLFYSLLLTFGLAFLFSWLKRRLWQWLLGLAFFASLVFYAWPAFQGHFFYERLRVEIPEAYFSVFAYFKHQAPASSRIANLPQHTFYGWQWHDWGYRGSGFLWYGIKQPILDRAFDVWSAPLEGYYWELQHALDQKDVKMLEAVFSKYDVDYVLLDSSIVNRNTAKPFNYAALSDLLAQSTRLKLVTHFDFLSLYAFADDENSREKEFLSLYENLPMFANSYKHSWRDQAYFDFHDYLSEPNNYANNASIIYPFPALFTNHTQKDLTFSLTEDSDYFYLQPKEAISDNLELELHLPDLLEVEEALPFRLTWQLEGQQLRLTLQALLPEIYWQQTKYYYDFSQEIILDAANCQASAGCYLNLNNQLLTEFSPSGSQVVLLQTKQRNTLALSTALKTEYFAYTFFDLASYQLSPRILSQAEAEPLLIKMPKINLFGNLLESELNLELAKTCRPLEQGSYFKEKRPEGNFYQATGTNVCDHFYLPELPHRQAYLFRLEAENWRSLPLTFAIQAESLGRSPLETYLSEGLNYQILPPTEDFNQGYTLYLSTDSYGREVNENFLQSAEVFAWPYEFLSRLQLRDGEELPLAAAPAACDFAVKKRALWLYRLDLPANCQAGYVKLSQAYDSGWLAWSKGAFLPHHQMNNWTNAWQLPENSSSEQMIYIFFWPQLLQYLGFGLLVGGVVVVIKLKR